MCEGSSPRATYTDPSYDRLSPDEKNRLANLLHFEEPSRISCPGTSRICPRPPPYLARLLGRLPVMTWTVRTPEDRERAERYADQMVFEGFVP